MDRGIPRSTTGQQLVNRTSSIGTYQCKTMPSMDMDWISGEVGTALHCAEFKLGSGPGHFSGHGSAIYLRLPRRAESHFLWCRGGSDDL